MKCTESSRPTQTLTIADGRGGPVVTGTGRGTGHRARTTTQRAPTATPAPSRIMTSDRTAVAGTVGTAETVATTGAGTPEVLIKDPTVFKKWSNP